jgi:hypothetical protein
MVNSPLAGVSRTVASISMAITLLGFNTIRSLALCHSLIASYRAGRCCGFDYEKFWSQSLARAVSARALAGKLSGTPPDEAFTIALMSKIGQLALATVFPAAYSELLSRWQDDPSLSICPLESEQFGLNHHEPLMMGIGTPGVCEAVRIRASLNQSAPPWVMNIAKIPRSADGVAILLKPAPYQNYVSSLFKWRRMRRQPVGSSAVYESARNVAGGSAIFSVPT